MGFEVHVVVTLPAPPNEATMYAIDHQFESATHAAGSKIVNIEEHVSMSDEADALAFVRSLVLDALPPRSTITTITATSD